jgi:hypothetical protein
VSPPGPGQCLKETKPPGHKLYGNDAVIGVGDEIQHVVRAAEAQYFQIGYSWIVGLVIAIDNKALQWWGLAMVGFGTHDDE